MMWVLLAFMSAALLGCYDFFKKVSLKDNSVIAVLFLNTLFSALLLWTNSQFYDIILQKTIDLTVNYNVIIISKEAMI